MKPEAHVRSYPGNWTKAFVATCLVLFTVTARAQVLPPDPKRAEQLKGLADWARSEGNSLKRPESVANAFGMGSREVPIIQKAYSNRAKQLGYAVTVLRNGGGNFSHF